MEEENPTREWSNNDRKALTQLDGGSVSGGKNSRWNTFYLLFMRKKIGHFLSEVANPFAS